MEVDKSKPGLIFPISVISASRQEELLRAAGAKHIISVKQTWRNLFKYARAIRDGDTVYFVHLSAVPTQRGDDELSPTSQAVEFLHEVVDAGALGVETYTGRTTASKSDVRGMIADAEKVLRSGGKRRPPAGYAKPGRPGIELDKATFEEWADIWRSPDYSTNAAALRAMGSPFVQSVAHKLFGPSGRAVGGRKKHR